MSKAEKEKAIKALEEQTGKQFDHATNTLKPRSKES
jgi:hypothetical protein